MNEPQFRYNPKTLRYERVRFSIWRTGSAFVAYAGFAFLFFIGLNLLQNFLIETKFEKSLAKENKALTEYKAVLTSQLTESNAQLNGLKSEEAELTEKLFEVPVKITPSQPKNDLDKHRDHL